ncbi:Similar to ninaC: Neither inactivation nor afterpotential protein C (Drosophila melanogaster) [Cotesia congregata]|uniref:Similar to ninaC: Neither inactivation nor afterpotential protein C (Drosophila melanogaster) n=1 Tax=Cotesia congregata TaxID=51543 RepID=A0A8J2ME90_COTCN|nr:Similar to ninaC: Neither inactivation nor afterpotential protein C (Drosophila melanogaster) [Cotesia congregata]
MSHNNIPCIFNDIKDPGDRFRLDNLMNKGVYGTVYSAIDTQAGHNKVAIKIQVLTSETQEIIIEEYRVLRDLSNHPNVPHFYGIYRNRCGRSNKADEIWLVMEFEISALQEVLGILLETFNK